LDLTIIEKKIIEMKKIIFGLSLLASAVFIVNACGSSKGGGKGLNLYTIEQDKELGAQVAAEIESNTKEYPILDPVKYKAAYDYVYQVRDKILNSGKVVNKDKFLWQVKIIHNDSVLNAFCTPGGYIYVYTGILKFLDSEDQFAGVMGHEIAHADMRHSTRQMTSMYGIETMLSVLTGNREMLKQVTAGLIGLKFSRNHETEADEKSVTYLCPTDYNAAGGGGFFEKIQALGGAKQPEFLSTHPDPGNRIENFNNNKTTMGCTGNKTYQTEYKAMVSKLPR